MANEIKWCLIRIGFEQSEAEKIVFGTGITTFGRSLQSTVKIDSPYCSRNHCTIAIKGDVIHLRDRNVSVTSKACQIAACKIILIVNKSF